ncbi:MAG: helicase, partial [Dysosmobacter sp.]
MIPISLRMYNDPDAKPLHGRVSGGGDCLIHDAKLSKRKELFAKVCVEAREVRIPGGKDTAKWKQAPRAGPLIALHDPFRLPLAAQRSPAAPLTHQQQVGNHGTEVEYRYVTEGTSDAYLYQLVESKQRFIAQI